MTVSTTHTKNAHTPDGIQTVFAFTFKTLKKEHVKIYLDDVLVADSLYTVSLLPSGVGGTVVFDAAPEGSDLEIRRETPRTQETGFPFGGSLSTLDIEQGLDRLTLIMQELIAGIIGPQGEQGIQGEPGQDGEMSGPGSSVNNALAVFNGTGGATLKQGAVPVNDGDVLTVSSGVWVASAGSVTFPSNSRILWGDPDDFPIPTGWEPMDGRTVTINGQPYVTPDTRGKVLYCAALDDTGSSGFTGATIRPDQIAGTKTHQHANGGTVTVDSANDSVGIAGQNVQQGSGFFASVGVPGGYITTGHVHAASIAGNTQSSAEAARVIGVAQLVIIKVDE